MTDSWKICDSYELRKITRLEIQPHLDFWRDKVFGDSLILFPEYSESERAALRSLRSHMGSPLELSYGVFLGDDLVGWHIGEQQSGGEFYMRNSAIIPQHQRKGLYSAMLQVVIKDLLALGFQVISSRHNTTNNAVIIPKLKQGFVITALETTDIFGTLVHLKYFANERRKKTLDFRVGQYLPDDLLLTELNKKSEAK